MTGLPGERGRYAQYRPTTDEENEHDSARCQRGVPRSRAGQEEELASRLEELVRASRSDAGVMIYDLHRSTTDPAAWFLYERYESEEHFNKHRENPVLRRFIADAATLLDGKLDVRRFKVITDLEKEKNL